MRAYLFPFRDKLWQQQPCLFILIKNNTDVTIIKISTLSLCKDLALPTPLILITHFIFSYKNSIMYYSINES